MRPPISTWLLELDAVLVIGLAIAVLLGWLAWQRRPTQQTRMIWLGALSLLATIVLRIPVAVLASARDLDHAMWVGPFDRLLGVTVLIMLGWTLTAGSRTWRVFLLSGFAATAITYLSWAQTWAQEFMLQPGLQSDPTGLTRFWDAWQIVLAVAVGGALVRSTTRVPAWLLAAIGALALGSFLELIDPNLPVPTWSRIGTLAAGALFVGAAVYQTMDLTVRRPAPLARQDPDRDPEEPSDSEPDDPDDPDALSLEAIAGTVLYETAARLRSSPVLFCHVDERGQMTVWGIPSADKRPRRLGRLPLAAHPTVSRAMGSTGLRLRTSRIARDVEQLYGLMGLSGGGPALLQPVTTTDGVAVIIAGRPTGRWRDADQKRLASVAKRAARTLEALQAGTDADGTDWQAQANRLEQIVENLSSRLAEIEGDEGASDRSVDPSVNEPESDSPADPSADEPDPDSPADESAGEPAPGSSEAAAETETEIDPETEAPDAGPAPEAVGEPAGSGPDDSASEETTPEAAPSKAPASSAAPLAPTALLADRPGESVHLEEAFANADPDAAFDARVLRYEMALEAIPWGLMVADADGGIVFANAASARLLHVNALAPGQPLVTVFPDRARAAGAMASCESDANAAVARGSGVPRPVELRFESPAVHVELEPLFDPSVGFLGAVALIRPDAEGALGVESRVLENLADALKSPMASILGYSDLLSRGVGLNQDQLDRYLQRIDANLARMQVNLENLLTMLEAGSNRLALNPSPLSLPEAVEAAIKRAHPQMDEKSVSVSAEFPDDLPEASIDDQAVVLILDNLLATSIQRSPQGGDVSVSAEAVSGNGGSAVVLTVADRGQPVLAKGGGTMELDEAGPGSVSLTVVRLLVDRLGGKAWVESKGGQTRFKVRMVRAAE